MTSKLLHNEIRSKKLKVLLLNVSSISFFYDQLVIPFGLTSLGSHIDNADYDIKGIEMNKPPEKIRKRYLKTDKEVLNEINKFLPDIVAMSTYASNICNVLFWAKLIKSILPNCFNIIGGNHASYIARECLEKCSGLDFVIRFEGEIPFKMICEKIKKKDYDFSNVPSLTYRINGKIKENPQIELIKDLSSLPILNRKYFEDKYKKKDEIYHADIISARGCPFNCTFCNCNHYWSKIYRVRLIDHVIKELKVLKKKNPNLKSVRFRDESITINKHRCKMLCDNILKNGLNLEFQAHSRLDGLNEEVIQTLSKAGFKLLFIGMESGSKAVLKRIKKGIDISRAEEIVSLLRKYGIKFRISLMTATPKEKFRETMETIKLIIKLKLKKNEYSLGTGVSIYPGTTECDKFLELNPNYEWLTKEYNFKGSYYADRDWMGNILSPKYIEKRNFIQTSIFLLFISPTDFFVFLKDNLIKLLGFFLRIIHIKKKNH